MERAAEGKFAYISWKIYQQDIIAKDFLKAGGGSRIYQVSLRRLISSYSSLHYKAKGVFNTPANVAWAFPPGSDLREKFDRIIRRLVEVRFYKIISIFSISLYFGPREGSSTIGCQPFWTSLPGRGGRNRSVKTRPPRRRLRLWHLIISARPLVS